MIRCPHCYGMLTRDYDGYESYLVCLMCGTEYDLSGESRRRTLKEYEKRFDIKYTHLKDRNV